MTRNHTITRIIIVWLTFTHGASAKDLAEYLREGEFRQGVEHFSGVKAGGEATNEELFSLGVVQFFAALENLAQDFHRMGLDSRIGQRAGVPFLRLPVPSNPNPEKASREGIRDSFERFHSHIESVNENLKDLNHGEHFSTPIDIAMIRIDINANGQLEESENFHTVYTFYNRRAGAMFKNDASVVIDFDLADAYWLKGYSHLLLALTDVILAHDWSKVYEHAAHVFFASVDSETGSVLASLKKKEATRYAMWADLIAGVHAMGLPVTGPERLKSAHGELLETVHCSRLTWGLIAEESDDQNEWIPNPLQTGVTGVQISDEMIDSWGEFLDEFEAILTGEKLVPHWRIGGDQGINLKRVFYDPRPFDPIFWMQGSAVIPYLEVGEVSSRETWSAITRTFRGNFIGFAIWVN